MNEGSKKLPGQTWQSIILVSSGMKRNNKKSKRKNKVPKYQQEIFTEKKPKSGGSSRKPFRLNLWSFSWADTGGKWSFEKIDDKESLSLLKKLKEFETKNPHELKRGGCHIVQVEDLSNKAKSRLLEIKKDDIDELYSFRISGRERIWAMRERIEDENVYYHLFRILWWDPKHKVCPSHLRNT